VPECDNTDINVAMPLWENWTVWSYGVTFAFCWCLFFKLLLQSSRLWGSWYLWFWVLFSASYLDSWPNRE